MENKFYLSDQDYKKGVSLMVRLCLDFVITKDEKILLTKRLIEPYKGFWHLPGGMVRKGESIWEASDRISTSELGLKITSKELIGYVECLDEQLPGQGIQTHSVSLVFKTVLEEGNLKESFQAKEMEFFSKIPAETIPCHKEFIKENSGKLFLN